MPVSPSFDLIGRVGVSDTDSKAPAAAGKLEQGTAFDYGVGAQYHINSGYALRADVTRSEFDNNKGQATTTSLNLGEEVLSLP
ncbi:MAG: outer membrane beta-barrel protein [Asticcacaulis sp.]